MNTLVKYLRISISWLLIALYSTVFAGWDMVHAEVHQDVVSHSVQTEMDPCHRSIFHGEQDAHKNHLTAFKYCASCHVVSQPPVSTEVVISVHFHPAVTESATYISFFAEQPDRSLFSSRAPPRFV